MTGQPPVALAPGTVFHGRYEVVRAMGAGGMGSLFEVVHRPTNRRRALKLMLPALVHDAELRARFELEARVTADVESEHIVETFDAGVDAETGAPFLVMELLRGQDLRALLHERGRLPAREVVVLLDQAALALERTHAAGIVHRDLKPDNLFVTQGDDGSPRLKILDFGIAKLVAQSAESIKTTRSMGNPSYMAPEQVRGDGDIDAGADLYSLGQIAFALLTGTAYWEADGRGAGVVYPLLLKIAEGAKVPATERARALGVDLPPAFDGWFSWATALDPADRAGDARALVTELARVLGVSIERAAPLALPGPSAPPAAPRATGATELTASLPAAPARFSARPGATFAVAVVALGALAAWRLGSHGPPSGENTSAPVSAPASPASTTAGSVPAMPLPASEPPRPSSLPPDPARASEEPAVARRPEIPRSPASATPAPAASAEPRRGSPAAPPAARSSGATGRSPPEPRASASALPPAPAATADPSDMR